MSLKLISADGIEGEVALREAAAGEYREIMNLVRRALNEHLATGPNDYISVEAVYADRVVVRKDSRLHAYPYTITDDNQVQLGTPSEVVTDHKPVALREAKMAFLEAEDDTGLKYLVRVIRAGKSQNNNFYPDAVLREAAPLFDGVRVFVKPDEEHIKGKGKDFHNLIGRLSAPKFIEGKSPNSGEIQATLELLDSAGEVVAKLREAYQRGMADDLFGFSIDADGTAKRRGKLREAKSITKVNSLDLIIEPSAGGQLIKLIEAVNPQEDSDVELRTRMIEAVKKANNGTLPDGLDTEDNDALETAYREATSSLPAKEGVDTPSAKPGATQAGAGVSSEDVDEKIRMMEARNNMRVTIADSKLPDAAKQKLSKDFDGRTSFVEADVTAAIKDEHDYLATFTESGHVSGLGGASFAEGGEDRSEKVGQMMDDFFDPSKKAMSFRECYVEITGDKGVTGLMQHCDQVRLSEAVGGTSFREAISAATFSNVLGDSITRAMLREYGMADLWSDWRWMVDVVPVSDFRTQERTRLGGYGDLPTVAENGPYAALTSPGDEKATYALEKRGGTETISMETIANDDVGVIQRIPIKLAMAAKRTLYKFVLDFLSANANVYDGAALFHASHNNLATGALTSTTFAAMRLAMLNQTELTSGEKLGFILRHLAVPVDMEEAAFDMFVRNTNNDETFVESRKPTVHVVPHWTDANNWYGLADKRETPLIELGFYNGQEDPELFVQDSPTQGSLFSNDQIKYKLRHIYKGAVMDVRGFQGAVVP